MKVIDSKILLTVTEKCDGECMIKFGNLVTPLEPKQYYWKAKVVSVGANVKEVNVNDTVLIYPDAGKEFVIEGSVYRTVTTSEIIAII